MTWYGYEVEKNVCEPYITLLDKGEANERSHVTGCD